MADKRSSKSLPSVVTTIIVRKSNVFVIMKQLVTKVGQKDFDRLVKNRSVRVEEMDEGEIERLHDLLDRLTSKKQHKKKRPARSSRKRKADGK